MNGITQKGIDMYITLTDTLDQYVERAIEIGKTGIPVRFERDGTHGTGDLGVIVKFQKAGFLYNITTYKGKYDEDAIRVEFHYRSKENGYI